MWWLAWLLLTGFAEAQLPEPTIQASEWVTETWVERCPQCQKCYRVTSVCRQTGSMVEHCHFPKEEEVPCEEASDAPAL